VLNSKDLTNEDIADALKLQLGHVLVPRASSRASDAVQDTIGPLRNPVHSAAAPEM